MKQLCSISLLAFAIACTKSSSVDAPASDAGASETAMTDRDAPMPHRPQLPQTVSIRPPAQTSPSYTIQGCASATRSAGAPNDGDDMTEAVHVGATTAGVVVSHKVRHACCLKGAVETSVEGTTVTIREQLTGSPCRCLCGSGIETHVPLAPGTYDVKVVVEAATQKPREVASQRVTVTATQ